jgi:glycosyltransferase involved in cell wall biosynthesis
MKISYGITVCDEAEEIYNLLDYLYSNIDDNDEIIILRDMDKTTDVVTKVINQQIGLYKPNQIKVVESSLNGDFATFKNNLIEHADSDYLFQIDADEMPNSFLIENIKPILKVNSTIDCFYIPRVNKVDGLTPEHILKWGWRVDTEKRINFPDPQMRLFKLGKGIKWKNRVHEVLTGYQTVSTLPYDTEDFCLYHIKSIDKQEKQNAFYDTL